MARRKLQKEMKKMIAVLTVVSMAGAPVVYATETENPAAYGTELEAQSAESEIHLEEVTKVVAEQERTTEETTEVEVEQEKTTEETTEAETEQEKTTEETTEAETEQEETTEETTEAETEQEKTTEETTEAETQQEEITEISKEIETELLTEKILETETETEEMPELNVPEGGTGWEQAEDGEHWIYWNNGEQLKNTTTWIDGAPYRFDADGYKVDGWYEDEYGNWYYYSYNSAGQLIYGLILLGDDFYYISSNGLMNTNTSIVQDGYLYIFGDDGKATFVTAVSGDGWVNVDGKEYYIRDNQIVTSEFITDENGTCYVGWNGVKIIDQMYSVWDSSTERDYTYYFDESGYMVKNCWWSDEWQNTCYFDNDGHRAEGITEIDGNTYYFNSYMIRNYSIIINGYFYHLSDDGTADVIQPVSEDGWLAVGQEWYYVKDQKLVTDEFVEYGGYLYYFGWNGVMYTETSFMVWDSQAQQSYYYRTDEKGHIVTGWYSPSYDTSSRFYYDLLTGRAASGITNIDGNIYYFYSDGRLGKNCTATDGTMVYCFDQNGNLSGTIDASTDGWKWMTDNWYYVKDGKLVIDDWVSDGTYWYYLNYDGKMLTDSVFEKYNEITGKYYSYRVDINGHMVTGWYYDSEHEGWYYYDANGIAASGITNIGGTLYYFYFDGLMRTNCTKQDDTNLYYFDENGVGTVQSLTEDGWKQLPSGWYYAKDGKLLKNTWLEIGGYYYYFRSNGKMYADGVYDIYDEEAGAYIEYRFDVNGCRVTGWYQTKNGTWYYYQVDGKPASGIKYFSGGMTYSFYYDGEMRTETTDVADNVLYYFGKDGFATATADLTVDGWKNMPDGWYYSIGGQLLKKEWLEIGGGRYFFDYSGIMVADTEYIYYDENTDEETVYRFDANGLMVTGWYKDANGVWYYYESDGHASNGIVDFGGTQYCFSDQGEMLTNREVYFGGKVYYADSQGICTETIGDGWLEVGADRYYRENGVLVFGWKNVNGKWYYFDEVSQEAYADGIYNIYGYRYCFDSEGVMMTGWILRDENEWAYADENGVLARNKWMVIDGFWYYFDGITKATGKCDIEGKYNLFDNSGVWQCELSEDTRGWIASGGFWYYVNDDGTLLCDEIATIDGASYCFDSYGRMVVDYENWAYYFGSDGVAITNQWKKDKHGNWRYYDENGHIILEGWKAFGSDWYYFNEGVAVTTDFVIDNKLYHFDASGRSDKQATDLANGWNLIDGFYYYYEGGKLARDIWKTIGNSSYYFDYDGRMKFDTVLWDYNDEDDSSAACYVGKDGAMVKSAWCNGGSSYAGADGKLLTGLQTIGGKKYYFDEDGYLMYSAALNDERTMVYVITSGGEVTDVISADSNGWKYVNGDWYYAVNGKFVRGRYIINGVPYYFYYNGRMASNIATRYGYADQNGVLTIPEGLYNGYYYSDGVIVTGPRMVDGKYYYFDDIASEGLFIVDGFYYYYDGKGSRERIILNEGWNYVGSDWYYVRNNSMVKDDTVEIGGVYYRFDYDGKMMAGFANGEWACGREIYVNLGADGLPESGWEYWDGSWYYFGENGIGYQGIRFVDGQYSLFAEDGRWIGYC